MLCKGTFRCLLACLISCPHILPPNPPTINLQITSCGWQKQWRATCKQRSAPATGCESCCSHAGGRGERSRCGPLCLQRGGCCSLTSQPRARMDAPRLPNSSHSCLSSCRGGMGMEELSDAIHTANHYPVLTIRLFVFLPLAAAAAWAWKSFRMQSGRRSATLPWQPRLSRRRACGSAGASDRRRGRLTALGRW